jgi:hypothetical protein
MCKVLGWIPSTAKTNKQETRPFIPTFCLPSPPKNVALPLKFSRTMSILNKFTNAFPLP